MGKEKRKMEIFIFQYADMERMIHGECCNCFTDQRCLSFNNDYFYEVPTKSVYENYIMECEWHPRRCKEIFF